MVLILSAPIQGCVTAPSEPTRLALPPLVSYSPEQQRKAADELAAIRPQAPTVGRMIDDYGNLRAAIRAARPQD